MDLQYFLNVLWRRKWLILATTLLAAALAYYFVGRQDDSFEAEATFSTGIMGGAVGTIQSEKNNPYIQDFQIKMHFDNLISSLNSRRNINFLIYKLLLHDMDGTEDPFRKMEDMDLAEVDFDLSQDQIQELLTVIEGKSDSLDFSFQHDPEMQKAFSDMAEALGYDYKNMLRYNLEVERAGDSDNIKVRFESENPELCAYAVNTFCDESVRFNKFLEKDTEARSLDITSKQARKKKGELDYLNSQLETLMRNSNIVNAEGDAESLIAQRKKLLLDKEEFSNKGMALRQNIAQLEADIRKIQDDTGFDKREKQNINQSIINLKELINKTEVAYLEAEEGPAREKLGKTLALYKLNLDKKLEEHAEEYVDERNSIDSKNIEEELFREKTQKQLELTETNERVKSIDKALAGLQIETRAFVGDDAKIKKMQTDIEIAKKEYEALLREASGSKRAFESPFFPIKILEYAQVPEKAMPKNRAIITAFSGIVGGVMSTIAILLMAFFDNSLNSPNKFQQQADVKLMGSVNKIKTKNLNLQTLFSSNGNVKSFDVFKESVRNLRFAIESTNSKRFLFTSTQKGEGKTFLIVTLAHTLMLKNKKILLVDTNFKNNTLTQMSGQAAEGGMLSSAKLIGESDVEVDFMTHSMGGGTFQLDNVDILGNKGSYLSPSEVFAGKDFENFIDKLSEKYDYIFFEGAALNDFSDSKELVKYVDRVISVFGSESELKQRDRDSIAFLKSLGNKFMGAILNKTKLQELEN